jgi:hypothetical protein
MSSLIETGVIEFYSSGFELYLPPTPFKSRFVMLDGSTNTFYDVDCEAPSLGNRTPWNLLAPETLRDPAIAFPPEQCNMLKPHAAGGMNFATGFLVSIMRREGERFIAEKVCQANVRPIEARYMNWDALKQMKGDVLPNEMRAGLMQHLWNRRPEASSRPISYVTSSGILDEMPRKWHQDGAALNDELDNMFAAGKAIPGSQRWSVGNVEVEQIQKSKDQAPNMVILA